MRISKTNILFTLAVLSILIIGLIIINIFFPNIGFPLNKEQAKIDMINNTLLALSTSYITGYIIYIITIAFPAKEKQKVFDPFINDIIYYFYSDTLNIYSFYIPTIDKVLINDIYYLEYCKFSDKNPNYQRNIINTYNKNGITNISKNLSDVKEKFINDSIMFFEYMTIEQLEIIQRIKKPELLEKIEVLDNERLNKNDKDVIKTQHQYFKEYINLIINLKNTI